MGSSQSARGRPTCPRAASALAPLTPGAVAAATAFPLLALPQNCILGVFQALGGCLVDAVSLSLCCKELWELGAAARRRHLCCAACGHVVANAAHAFTSDTFRHTPRLDLPDCASYALDAACLLPAAGAGPAGASGMGTAGTSAAGSPVCGCALGPETPLRTPVMLSWLRSALFMRRVGSPAGYEVRAQEVLCGGCRLHLGLRIVQMGGLRAGAADACISDWHALQLLGACFLGKRYLRLRTPGGQEEHLGRPPPPSALALYTCTAARSSLRPPGSCGAPLFHTRDVLSRQHCWDAGGGPELAFFINAFLPGAVEARNERQELLCQGDMRVADVFCCTCGARIGWKFAQDLEPALENCNQVGRYGVVRSSISKQGRSSQQLQSGGS